MIIGLSGLKGSGKDTVGAYLVKEHSFERRSFADPLKRSFAALFDIPLWEIENMKNDSTVFMTIGYTNFPTDPRRRDIDNKPNAMWSPIREFTFREGLQRYGTESHRNIFGEDFWLDQALPLNGYYTNRAIVVTDVRFPNEADRIKKLGGYIVKVERPNSGEVHHHSSEADQVLIVPHYKLVNDSTVVLLYNEVEKMLKWFEEDGA